jgi:hypothetical protein
MVLNTQFMGKLRTTVMSAMAGLTLAGCNEANAEDNTQAEVQKVAAVVETTKVTRDQCIALATKAEKLECMKQLRAQRRAEITTKTEVLEKEKTEGDKLDATIDVLNKEIDAVYVEAAQKSGTQ